MDTRIKELVRLKAERNYLESLDMPTERYRVIEARIAELEMAIYISVSRTGLVNQETFIQLTGVEGNLN